MLLKFLSVIIEAMFYQFLPAIFQLSRDQCANFVLQRLIENIEDQKLIDSIVERIRKHITQMATNQYACRVLQSVNKHLILFLFFLS